MRERASAAVNGYVLAGGKSSRMGRDKALLELEGKPLVLRAVEKLRWVCADVYILANRPELEMYAPVISDLHDGCGPLAGIEAAFSHSEKIWNLFMAVDMPFLPVEFLENWVKMVVEQESARISMFYVDGRPQPALCMLHKDVAPYVEKAVAQGNFKLLLVLKSAAEDLAMKQKMAVNTIFLNLSWSESGSLLLENGYIWKPTHAQQKTQHLWFVNLNTPDEFAAAEAFATVLEVD